MGGRHSTTMSKISQRTFYIFCVFLSVVPPSLPLGEVAAIVSIANRRSNSVSPVQFQAVDLTLMLHPFVWSSSQSTCNKVILYLQMMQIKHTNTSNENISCKNNQPMLLDFFWDRLWSTGLPNTRRISSCPTRNSQGSIVNSPCQRNV